MREMRVFIDQMVRDGASRAAVAAYMYVHAYTSRAHALTTSSRPAAIYGQTTVQNSVANSLV